MPPQKMILLSHGEESGRLVGSGVLVNIKPTTLFPFLTQNFDYVADWIDFCVENFQPDTPALICYGAWITWFNRNRWTHGECWAIHYGMRQAKSENWQWCIYETNCVEALYLTHQDGGPISSQRSWVRECVPNPQRSQLPPLAGFS